MIRALLQFVLGIILIVVVIVVGFVLIAANNVVERIQGKPKHYGNLV